MATSFVPLAVLGYAIAALAWWLLRRAGVGAWRRVSTLAALVAVAGLLAHAAWLAPSYLGSHASGRPDLTVLTSNLRLGLADASSVTALAKDQHADVVVVEEATPDELTALDGLRQQLPHVAGQSYLGAYGTVVFSRFPLEQVTGIPVSKGGYQMRVAAPTPFTLIALHTSQPATWPDLWRKDHAAVLAAVRRLDGPVIVAGDFNATLDHRPMRDLLGAGLSDAAVQANSGWQPTWPSDRAAGRGLPEGLSVMAIDHVLVSRQFSAISTSTHVIKNSDHRALLARLAVR
jgi:endonuclease/exonuclease/phosphatase (EEP) superfamily protein YafD